MVPPHVQVRGAGPAEIAFDVERIARMGDALFRHPRVVDAGRAGELEIAPVPARPVQVELRVGRSVELQQGEVGAGAAGARGGAGLVLGQAAVAVGADRKSTRLNSSHVKISYAVFC